MNSHEPVSPDLGDSVDLSGERKVFCESSAGLDRAFELGLPRDVLVCAKSPALCRRSDLNLRILQPKDEGALRDFYHGTHEFLLGCFDALIGCGIARTHAVSACQAIWVWGSEIIVSALLSEEDFKQPALVLNCNYSGNQNASRYALPWSRILGKCLLLREVVLNVDIPEPFSVDGARPTARERLSVMGIRHFIWRCAQQFWPKIPSRFGRNRLYYYRDNELLRDIGAHFVLRGYRPVRLEFPSQGRRAEDEREAAFLIAKIEPLLLHRMAEIACSAAHGPLLSQLKDTLAENFAQYAAARIFIEALTRTVPKSGNELFLSNIPFGPHAAATADHASQNGLIFAGIQHGVTREFLDRPQNFISYENSAAPCMVAMTPKSAKLSANNAFSAARHEIIAAGLPNDFRYRLNTAVDLFPIIYIGVLHQYGYFFNSGNYSNDIESCRREIGLFSKVLGQLPHKVSYKPYPASRYVDRDFVLDEIGKFKNVRLLQTSRDLRFLIMQFGVLITKGASSTLGWCLASGKPLVYIDSCNPGYRMSREAAAAFQRCAFYFDERDPKFHEKLYEFLQQKISDIKSAWSTKESERREFLSEYMGPITTRAGKSGYRGLTAAMAATR